MRRAIPVSASRNRGSNGRNRGGSRRATTGSTFSFHHATSFGLPVSVSFRSESMISTIKQHSTIQSSTFGVRDEFNFRVQDSTDISYSSFASLRSSCFSESTVLPSPHSSSPEESEVYENRPRSNHPSQEMKPPAQDNVGETV